MLQMCGEKPLTRAERWMRSDEIRSLCDGWVWMTFWPLCSISARCGPRSWTRQKALGRHWVGTVPVQGILGRRLQNGGQSQHHLVRSDPYMENNRLLGVLIKGRFTWVLSPKSIEMNLCNLNR